jgi:hypothetical protein
MGELFVWCFIVMFALAGFHFIWDGIIDGPPIGKWLWKRIRRRGGG